MQPGAMLLDIGLEPAQRAPEAVLFGCSHADQLPLARQQGAKIVFDVKCSQSLIDDITRHGGVPVMWKTGHSHLKRKMRDDKILLGGEVSGHMFFAEGYYGVDDGLLAACKIVDIIAREPGPASRQKGTPLDRR